MNNNWHDKNKGFFEYELEVKLIDKESPECENDKDR